MMNHFLLGLLLLSSLASATNYDDICGCDLELVLDTSCSIPDAGRTKMMRFAGEIVKGGFKKIGVVAFDKRVRVVQDPTSNEKDLVDFVKNKLPEEFCDRKGKSKCCNTRTDLALKLAEKELEDLGRPNVCKVILVVTDGKTFPTSFKPQTVKAAKDIKNDHSSWNVLALGIGKNVNYDELRSIATGSGNQNVIQKPTFNSLRGHDICSVIPDIDDHDQDCYPDDDDEEDYDGDDDVLTPSK